MFLGVKTKYNFPKTFDIRILLRTFTVSFFKPIIFMKKIAILFACSIYFGGAWSQQTLLQSGPMIGYAEMQEVMLWVQTTTAAQVQIEYWEIDKPHSIFETEKILTQKAKAYTAHLLADNVEPGEVYGYRLLINDKEVATEYPLSFQTPALWQYRTDPPEIKIALGSCAFVNEARYDRPGKPYGGGYEIFTAIHAQQPHIMLWLGDNTYMREPDWYSKTGMHHRYTHTRSLPEMQPLLGNAINLAIWDDHDYGPNDSDRSFYKKDLSLEVFQDFWANPGYGIGGQGGTTAFYEWADVQFFMLDDRWFRTPNDSKGEEKIYLGKAQMDWLIDALVGSRATFKFVLVGGQVLNPVQKYETMANLAPKEREELLNRIAKEGIQNVVFLTGDRHHSELSKTEVNGTSIYDWTVSPLTSGTHAAGDEANTLRVEGSYFGEKNFGMIAVTGKKKERKLTMTLHDAAGKEVWKFELPAK